MNALLFSTTALIWGSTWLAIKLQLGQVSPLWSLVYRFGTAAVILLGFCFFTKVSLTFSRSQHKWIAIQAAFAYFLNYVFFYFATDYFVSGIVATLFASVIVMNIINARIFLGNPIKLKTVLGALIGLVGLACIVWAEITRLEEKDIRYIVEGLALCLGGAICSSFGQITAIVNTRNDLPILQTNAWGYAYGALFTLMVALLLGHTPSFDFSWTYVSSLLYLATFGTVVAFLCYLTLITRIGPEKSAYAFVLIPIIAMGLSSFYEDMIWTPYTISGSILVLIGNIVIMARRGFRWRFWESEQNQASAPAI